MRLPAAFPVSPRAAGLATAVSASSQEAALRERDHGSDAQVPLPRESKSPRTTVRYLWGERRRVARRGSHRANGRGRHRDDGGTC